MMLLEISYCPRCHENHGNVEFQELDSPIGCVHYWAMCPTNKHPILLQQFLCINGSPEGPKEVRSMSFH